MCQPPLYVFSLLRFIVHILHLFYTLKDNMILGTLPEGSRGRSHPLEINFTAKGIKDTTLDLR